MSMIAAGRYAAALYREASKHGAVEDVLKHLGQLRDLAKSSEDFKKFLGNPLLSSQEQKKVLEALFQGKIPTLILNFMVFVASKRRLYLFIEMINAYEAIYREEHQEIIMTVKSAQALDDAFKKKLSEKIAQLTKKKVIGQYSEDKSMIGGVRVWAAGKLYEYSFNNELQDYKRKALQNV